MAFAHHQGDVNKLQDDCAALKPAAMVGVPRVWERVREGAMKKLAARGPISTVSAAQDIAMSQY